MSNVPTVDLDRDPEVVARELDEVCRQIGFLQIVGHGVADDASDRAWDAAVAFFDLPLTERMAVASPHPGYPYGYSAFAGEALSRSLGSAAAADLKEVFNAGPVDPPLHRRSDPAEEIVYSANLWPAALPELELAWTEYYRVMLTLSGRLMSLFARALQLPAGYFASSIDHSPSALRANNYPAQPRTRSGATPGRRAHRLRHPDHAPAGLGRRPGGDRRAGSVGWRRVRARRPCRQRRRSTGSLDQRPLAVHPASRGQSGR